MIKYGFSGHFRLEVYKAGTRNLQKVREFDNLITNAGLDTYGNGPGRNLGRCWVGTGTATPTVNDNALAAPLAYQGMPTYMNGPKYGQTNWNGGASENYTSHSLLIVRFGVGKTTGNLTEVGLSTEAQPGDSNWALWCRALILDDNGNPTSLTVLENEYLEVRYTLNVHPFLGDVPFTFEVDGEQYQATARMASVQNSAPSACWGNFTVGNGYLIQKVCNSNELGPVTSNLLNGKWANCDACPYSSANFVFEPYVMGSYYRDFSCSNLGLGDGNVEGGILGLQIGPRFVGNQCTGSDLFNYWTQVALDHPIPKDNTNTMRFTVRTSWGRYEGS